MLFLTTFGAYSLTGTPALAGTTMAMPRAWPSFSVACASLLTKVASTAASSGRNSSRMRISPSWMASSRVAMSSRSLLVTEPSRSNRACCRQSRRRPNRCGGARDRCQGCESGVSSMFRDSAGLALSLARDTAVFAANKACHRHKRAKSTASPRAKSKGHCRRDYPGIRAVCRRGRRSSLLDRAGDCHPGRRGARLFRLRLGADLHSADRRGV